RIGRYIAAGDEVKMQMQVGDASASAQTEQAGAVASIAQAQSRFAPSRSPAAVAQNSGPVPENARVDAHEAGAQSHRLAPLSTAQLEGGRLAELMAPIQHVLAPVIASAGASLHLHTLPSGTWLQSLGSG